MRRLEKASSVFTYEKKTKQPFFQKGLSAEGKPLRTPTSTSQRSACEPYCSSFKE
jgi:hypothetical protein